MICVANNQSASNGSWLVSDARNLAHNTFLEDPMTETLKPIQAQILGTAIVEILSGELSDETIAAVDSLKRGDIPEPLNDLVGMMHGMTTHPPLRQSVITMLQTEIAGAAYEAKEKLQGPTAQDTWGPMQSFFFDIFENNHLEDMLEEEIKILPDPEQVQGWTVPLISHVKSTKARGKELMLELLDVLEDIIKKRRAQLRE